MKVGVIGLGTMGQPIARRIARAGHEILAWNRTPGRTDSLPRDAAVAVRTPGKPARPKSWSPSLRDDAAVEAVMFDGGRLITTGMPGLIHVGMSTISESLARRLAAAHEAAGQSYVSAPMFGPPDAAAAGRLLIVAGGPRNVVERVRPGARGSGKGPVHRRGPRCCQRRQVGREFPDGRGRREPARCDADRARRRRRSPRVRRHRHAVAVSDAGLPVPRRPAGCAPGAGRRTRSKSLPARCPAMRRDRPDISGSMPRSSSLIDGQSGERPATPSPTGQVTPVPSRPQ